MFFESIIHIVWICLDVNIMAQSRPLWQTQPSLQQVANEIQLITEAASLLDSPSLPVTFAVRKNSTVRRSLSITVVMVMVR